MYWSPLGVSLGITIVAVNIFWYWEKNPESRGFIFLLSLGCCDGVLKISLVNILSGFELVEVLGNSKMSGLLSLDWLGVVLDPANKALSKRLAYCWAFDWLSPPDKILLNSDRFIVTPSCIGSVSFRTNCN